MAACGSPSRSRGLQDLIDQAEEIRRRVEVGEPTDGGKTVGGRSHDIQLPRVNENATILGSGAVAPRRAVRSQVRGGVARLSSRGWYGRRAVWWSGLPRWEGVRGRPPRPCRSSVTVIGRAAHWVCHAGSFRLRTA